VRALVAALAIAASAIGGPARAETAASLFERGQFAAAADAGRSRGTADSLVVAAQASLALAGYEIGDEDKALMLLGEARADAERALALAPNDVGALLQKAIAMGYAAKLKRSRSGAKAARKLMLEATERAPGSALAWAALGGWHCGAVADLGKLLAGAILGAKMSKCIEGNERAVALEPQSPVYRTFYAIALVDVGRVDRAKLRQLLTPAANGRGGDGFDMLLRARARALLTALDGGNEDALEQAAEKAKPFAMLD
jgi:predicted Zn-dependent protease